MIVGSISEPMSYRFMSIVYIRPPPPSDEGGRPTLHLFIPVTIYTPTGDCFGRELWKKIWDAGPKIDLTSVLRFIDGCNELLPELLTPGQRKEAELTLEDFDWACLTEHAFIARELDDEERAVRQILAVLPSSLLSTDSSMPIHELQDLGLPPAPKLSDSDLED